MVKSIFNLENRTDLKTEVFRIGKITAQKEFSILGDSEKIFTFWELVDSCFELWPYRYTATNSSEYFKLKGISKNLQKMSNEEYFYYLQFIFDFINWFDGCENFSIIQKKFENELHTLLLDNSLKLLIILQNIRTIAELCNYNIKKVGEHCTFIKRDADVDSILPALENEENIRFVLLEYNDFRIENDIKQKRIILKQIGDYLEPRRKFYNSYNKTLTDRIFNLLNKMKIRHFDADQKEFSDQEYLDWYDKLYKMMIHLIRTPTIVEIQNEVKKLCSQ